MDYYLVLICISFSENTKNIFNFFFDYITESPGIHFNKIYRNLNLSVAVVQWHLKMLLKFNFIKKEKIGNFNAYFIFDVNNKNFKIMHIISREKYRRIIEFLRLNNKGHSIFQISKELGTHRNTISKYLEILDKIGLVYNKKLPNKTLFFLNENSFNENIS